MPAVGTTRFCIVSDKHADANWEQMANYAHDAYLQAIRVFSFLSIQSEAIQSGVKYLYSPAVKWQWLTD